MSLRLIGAVLVVATAAPVARAQTLQCTDLTGVPPVESVRFDTDVLPILEDDLLQCTTCHGTAANLPLDQGAASHGELFCVDTQGSVPEPPGKRVVPGAPMESWLLTRHECRSHSAALCIPTARQRNAAVALLQQVSLTPSVGMHSAASRAISIS